MYNLIKLQKHDAFYQSREGGKCSIKCFNTDLQCHTTSRAELRLLSTHGWMDGWMDTHTRRFHKRACSSLKI